MQDFCVYVLVVEFFSLFKWESFWYLLIAKNIHLSSQIDGIDTFEISCIHLQICANSLWGYSVIGVHTLKRNGWDNVYKKLGKGKAPKINYFLEVITLGRWDLNCNVKPSEKNTELPCQSKASQWSWMGTETWGIKRMHWRHRKRQSKGDSRTRLNNQRETTKACEGRRLEG